MVIEGKGRFRDFDPTYRKSINAGYIVVPANVDRAEFISTCLRTERVSIQVENGGGLLNNCYISKSALRDIRFPLVRQNFGSAVIFFTEPFGGKAIVVGVVGADSDAELNKEDIWTIKKIHGDNYAILSVDGNGQVNIDVIGIAGAGKLNINVRNDDHTSEVNINVKGSINLYTEGDTNITALDGNLNLTTNIDVNITSENNVNIKATEDVTVDSKKLLVHKADEAMVRGDELQTQIDKSNKLLDALAKAIVTPTVNTGTPGSPDTFQISLIAAIAGKTVGDFTNIKSEKSFLE